MNRRGGADPRRTIALGSLFLSGAAGLIYEVCWVRRAALVFGSTSLSLSTVLAVFFFGLAAGSEVFGRVSVRTSRPLKLFALLEITIAALALASLASFSLADSLYGTLYRAHPDPTIAHWALRVVLVAFVLLPPTFLMGGTLPLFCAQFVTERSRITGPVGLLYALNTLGAAVGCMMAGLWLIPTLGVKASMLFAAVLNVASGSMVGLMQWQKHGLASSEEREIAEPMATRRSLVPALFFITGFVALGQEVLWARYLALLVKNTVHTYTLTLAVVLLGIVLGSIVASRLSYRSFSLAKAFGTVQVLLGILVVGLMMLPPLAWRGFGNDLWIYVTLMLAPATLSGAAFPLAVRLVVDDPKLAGRGVGRMAAVNTAGGIAGSLIVGFVALPVIGLQSSLLFTTGLSLLAGITAWLFLEREHSLRWAFAAALALLVWSSIPPTFGTRIPDDFLGDPHELVESREGLQSNLAVVNKEGDLRLEIDRWWQGQERKNHQIMAAHLPMLLHPDPRRVLVVGAGAGQTPRRFLFYDIDRLDCVDIEPEVFDLIRSHFPSRWMEDPRVYLIAADGRNYVAHTETMYDIVSLELGQIFRPGVASFYTVDFYEEVRDRLAPGGVVSQFVPITLLSTQDFRNVIGSFLEVFPESSLWYNTSELLLIGTRSEPVGGSPAGLPLGGTRIDLVDSNEQIYTDLRYSHWGGTEYWLNRPEVVLACFLMGPRGLASLSEGARVYRDDRPVLEYAASDVDPSQANELPILSVLRDHLEPAPGSLRGDIPLDSVIPLRAKNLKDIEASFMIRRGLGFRDTGDYARVEELLRRALKANPENVEANRLMGDVLFLQGRLELSRLHYARALSMRSDDALSRRGLAFVLHREGRYDEALVGYQEVLDLNPADAEAHNNLGTILGQLGNFKAARWHFEEAIRIRPTYEDALKNLERLPAVGKEAGT